MGIVVGYLRVSSEKQNTESQRAIIESKFKVERWYEDHATSGVIKGIDRRALGELLNYVREGDTVVVYAIDRLGRNTIDVLNTVERLKLNGVSLVSIREGFDLTSDHGKLLLTMLAGLAELERKNIKARQMSGINRAKAEGKSLGRRKTIDNRAVLIWRSENNASISMTAEHFGISSSSVKRACS
ncbi:Site-specific DNA recombinase [Pseudidiomarina planktonica]|uniref:Site-specific DNA recombinase n=1 Tax=Pseudidiomarina planktonica TaxID=1323738 RepID=A0A1Y6FXE8_9GAMM|nr:recombinase family protein [Pseudidiomarina planktonica]RUO63250.1 recombinase family protein [Pseudidiomarina planktonica]SMQ80535.1 Site-specific DNA recombinase [Pseudidiomarina planktonica]